MPWKIILQKHALPGEFHFYVLILPEPQVFSSLQELADEIISELNAAPTSHEICKLWTVTCLPF